MPHIGIALSLIFLLVVFGLPLVSFVLMLLLRVGPCAMPTLLDIAKANGSDGIVGLVDETTKTHPEIKLAASRTIRGIMYKTLVRVSLGRTTGSFRSANAGSTPVKNVYENRTVETFIIEPRIETDRAVADRSEDGPQAYIAMEAEGVLEGEMQGLASQFYYGSGNNARATPA
jgi:hypothetical protein